jgi:CBS domain-containing protein
MEINQLIKDDYLVLSEDATLSELIGKLKQFEKRTALIFRKDKYLGLIEKKKLLKSRIYASKTKLKNFIQKTPILSEHADFIETAYLMYENNLDYVPVESNKKIVGVVNALDLLSLAKNLGEFKKTKVEDIKLVKPNIVNKDDPVSTAMTVMYQNKVDHVPLYDKGKLYGIITFKDILRGYLNWSPKRDVSAKFNAQVNSAQVETPKIDHLPVENFSTTDNLETISPKESLTTALETMYTKGISDLLVMDGNEFLGLLTIKSLLKKIGSTKVQKNFSIKFVGLNKIRLQSYQKYNVQKIASNEAMKLQRKIKNDMNLTIHIKSYDKQGGEQKFSVNLKMEFPGQIITSSQEDWDLETALRKTFNNAKNTVDKKFKN